MIHRRFRGQCFRGTIDDEIQEKEVVLQFRQMRFRYGDGSFRAISDVKKALQAFGDGFNVDRVQNIGTKRRIPFFSEVATSDAEIVRREISFDDGDEKVVVQVFDETVDGVREFARFVKRTQMPEVAARLIAGETVLNVAGIGGPFRRQRRRSVRR